MAWCEIRKIKSNLRQHVEYIKNPAKTTNPDCISTTKHQPGISRQQMEQLITGINCDSENTIEDFRDLLNLSSKTKPIVNVLYSVKQSFKEGEVSPQKAHQIGVELAQNLWGDNFMVLVATHTNTKHIHNHIDICAVGLDGRRFHNEGKVKYQIRNESDYLCRKYHLSIIKPSSDSEKYVHYGEWRAESDRYYPYTHRGMLKYDIDEVIRYSISMNEFYDNLRKLGYTIKDTGKYKVVLSTNTERGIRLGPKLGKGYSEEDIQKRIASEYDNKPLFFPYNRIQIGRLVAKPKRPQYSFFYSSLLAAVYRYARLIGVYPKYQKDNLKWISPKLRDDITRLQMLSDEVTLLAREEIRTIHQLTDYKDNLNTRLERWITSRNLIKRQLEKTKDPEEKSHLKEKLSDATFQVKYLRYRISLCNDIEENNKRRCQKMQEELAHRATVASADARSHQKQMKSKYKDYDER